MDETSCLTSTADGGVNVVFFQALIMGEAPVLAIRFVPESWMYMRKGSVLAGTVSRL